MDGVVDFDPITAELPVVKVDYTIGEVRVPFSPEDGVESFDRVILDIDKQVKISQLRDEIIEATGVKVKTVVQDRKGEPDILFIAPATDPKIVRKVYEDHVVNLDYGRTTLEIAGLRALDKAREGKTLTLKEVSAYIGAFGG